MSSIAGNDIAMSNMRNLKGLRLRYSMSIEELASIADCKPEEMQAYEDLQELPPVWVYNNLADYFKWAHCRTPHRPFSSSFFQNRDCEYFPCHKVANPENFSCLFCFCPLYTLQDCWGNPSYLPSGIKDCTNCTRPHYDYDSIIQRLRDGVNA